MPFLTRKRVILFAALVFLGCVIFSVYVMELRRQSLQFHTRDYNYFIEHAARLADPNLRDRMALNGEGFNFLGMTGSESAVDIFQAVHAEYFRYSYALLYAIFRSPWPLYLFFSVVFFLPVLYAALLPRPSRRPSYLPVIFLILLYVLYPATFPSAVGDLRSRFLFSSAWVLVMLAVVYDRPFREKLFFFLLLLAIREEGIVLGGLALVMNFFYTRDAVARKKQTIIFLVLDLLALVFFLGFMRWSGYLPDDLSRLHLPLPGSLNAFLFSRRGLAALAGLGAAVLAFGVWLWPRRPVLVRRAVLAAAHFLAVVMSAAPLRTELPKWIANQGGFSLAALFNIGVFLSDPYSALVVYMLIFLLVLGFERAWSAGSLTPRAAWAAGLAALCALFLAMTLQTFPAEVRRYRAEVAPARLVWDFKTGIDRYQTGVLVDYNTWQAFYDTNEVVVYNRLPLWIAHPEQRFYPANKKLLAKVMSERIDVAVIAVESLADVREVAQMAGLRVEQVAANDRYMALRFIRGPGGASAGQGSD